jgi:hypothetical protein
MLKKARCIGALLAALFVTSICGPAYAQFTGDVFFVSPSIVVPQGGTGDLQLVIFAGSNAFGATEVTLSFDDTKLQILDVAAVITGSVAPPLVKWRKESGKVKILVVNDKSSVKPIGTVGLAKISVKPLAGSGERLSVNTAVVDSYSADRTKLTVGTGYAAEISVGAAVASNNSVASIKKAASSSDLVIRATALRPPGSSVLLYLPNGDGTFHSVDVQTGNPNSQSD